MDAVLATNSRRLDGLDALRGIAATAVMIYHYTIWYAQELGGHAAPGVSFSFRYGNFCVELFFIVSGFVIMMTLERAGSPGDFLISRFARLYPAFLASLGFTIISGVALGEFGPPYDLARLLANLTMAPELFNAHAIDGSYWSLMYELAFYSLAGCAFFLLRQRSPEYWCAAWLFVSLAMRIGGADKYCVRLVQLSAAPYCQLFVIGVMLYRFHSARATVSTWTVLALAFVVTLFGPQETLYSIPRPGYSCLILCFTGLVWIARTPLTRHPAIAPLLFLGRISYPLYLVHQELGLTIIARLESSGAAPDIAVTAAAIIAIVSAWAISSVVEYPARKWLLKRYKTWRRRAPASFVIEGHGEAIG